MYVHICIAIGFSWDMRWDLWLWRNSMILGIFVMRLWCSHLGMRPRTWEDAKGVKDGCGVLKKKHQTKPDEDCTIKVLTKAMNQNLKMSFGWQFLMFGRKCGHFLARKNWQKAIVLPVCVWQISYSPRYTWCTDPLFILQLVFYREFLSRCKKRIHIHIKQPSCINLM